jgi:hypothetical protein
MPTTRQRRSRHKAHSNIIEMLIARQTIELTEEARQEVLEAFYFGWSDHPTLPDLESLAHAQLVRWGGDY